MMWNILGRFLFFALMIVQCVFLASYPAVYEDRRGWHAASILFLPAAVGFWWWMNSTQRDLGYALIFGALYVWVGLVPSIGIVFGRTGDKIEKKGFWNPSTLKMTLCITPLLLVIAFHTAASSGRTFTRATECLLKAVINLFDGIELLGVVLDENECSHGISSHFKNTLVAFACISYLWLPVVVAVEWDDKPAKIRVIYYFIQAVFEAIFLGLRLGLSLGYGMSASIFISKNIFLFIVHIRQIFSFCFGNGELVRLRVGCDEASPTQATSPENSTSDPPEQQDTSPRPSARQITYVVPVEGSSAPPSAPPPFNPEISPYYRG